MPNLNLDGFKCLQGNTSKCLPRKEECPPTPKTGKVLLSYCLVKSRIEEEK